MNKDHGMPEQRKIPLFPLHTVLFPGMILPLYIFEERYKRMIYKCVTEDMPFGVVLIRKGSEVGSGATIFDVGTAAKITKVDPHNDGRMTISALGTQRFKVLELFTEEPYMVGLVEDFPLKDVAYHAGSEELIALRELLSQYVEMVSAVSKVPAPLKTPPEEAIDLAFLAATVLHIPIDNKQELLSEDSLYALLQKEYKILKYETHLLRFLDRNTPSWVNIYSSNYTPN